MNELRLIPIFLCQKFLFSQIACLATAREVVVPVVRLHAFRWSPLLTDASSVDAEILPGAICVTQALGDDANRNFAAETIFAKLHSGTKA